MFTRLYHFLASEMSPFLLKGRRFTSYIDEGILKRLETQGFVSIPNFYSPEKCDELKSTLEKLLDQYKDQIQLSRDEADQRLFGVEHADKEMKAYLTDPFILKACASYFRTKPHLIDGTVLGAKLSYTWNNVGSGLGWHRDAVFYKQFKSILYLSDVTEKNGPFEFLPGSHTALSKLKTTMKSGIRFDQDRLSEEEVVEISQVLQKKTVKIPAKKGTLLLADTTGVHRGAPIEEGVRYALTNYMYPKIYLKKHTIPLSIKESILVP